MFNVYLGTPLQRQRVAEPIHDLSDNNTRVLPLIAELGGWDAVVDADQFQNNQINQRVRDLPMHNNNVLRDSNIDNRRIIPRRQPGTTDDNDDANALPRKSHGKKKKPKKKQTKTTKAKRKPRAKPKRK